VLLEGINYLHAKFLINILKKKKIIKLLELWLLWLKRKEKQKKKIANTKELLLQCYHAIMLSYLRPFPIDFS